MKYNIIILLILLICVSYNSIATNMTIPSSYTYAGTWFQGWTHFGVCCYGGQCGQGYCSVDGDFMSYSITGFQNPCYGNWSYIIKDYDIHKNVDTDIQISYQMRAIGTYGYVSISYYDYSTDSWSSIRNAIWTDNIVAESYIIPKSDIYSNLTHYKVRINITALTNEPFVYASSCNSGAFYYDDYINFSQTYVTKFTCQNGICCNYDEQPFLTKDIDWSCTTYQDSECLASVFKDGELISVSPKIANVKEYGQVPALKAKNGILNFKVDSTDMYVNNDYQVKIMCHINDSSGVKTAEYTGIITPVYGELKEVGVMTVHIKNNMSYIIWAIIVIFIISTIYIILKKI